jgi:hypothetical protein
MTKPTVYLGRLDLRVHGVRKPTQIQIVCGDCSLRADEAGNSELLPFRTFLGADGRCYSCGGRSFVVASELCGALRRTITERKQYALEQFTKEPFTNEQFAGEVNNTATSGPELWVKPGVGDVLGSGGGESEHLREQKLLVN